MPTEKDNLYRQFSTTDIKNFRKDLTTVIIAPYSESQVKGVGYNLTASNMVYSLAKRKLLTIYNTKTADILNWVRMTRRLFCLMNILNWILMLQAIFIQESDG